MIFSNDEAKESCHKAIISFYNKNINLHSSEIAKNSTVRQLVKTSLLTFYNNIQSII